MVLSEVRDPINRVAERVAAVFEWVGLRPNHVSLLALAIASLGAYLIATHQLILGAAVAGLGNILDLLDGSLARRTGQETPFGGYLDSLLDRFADGVSFFAVGWHYQTPWIWAAVYAGFLTAVTTSYARARVYEDADPPRDAWPDLVERGERLLILLFAVGFQGIAEALGATVQFLPWVVVVLALLGLVTVVQRSLRARRYIREGS